MRTYLKFWILFLSIYGLDLTTKTWVVENSTELRRNPIEIIDLVEGREAFLEFTYVTNPGAAWSMFSDYPGYLTILALAALLGIFIFRKNLEIDRPPLQIMFGLICGGICGNLTDRLFRTPAEVVDFVDVYFPFIEYDYPVFNVADAGIFLGATTYFFWGFAESKKENLVDEKKQASSNAS